MSPPDRPESQSSNVDDPEWIKGLVAKALLQAADEGIDSSAMAPTPVSRPVAAWPELAPLNTSSYGLDRTGATKAPTPPVEPFPISSTPETVMAESPAVAPATQAVLPAAASDTVTSGPTAIPKHVAPPANDLAPAHVPAPVLESIADLSSEAGATSAAAQGPLG